MHRHGDDADPTLPEGDQPGVGRDRNREALADQLRDADEDRQRAEGDDERREALVSDEEPGEPADRHREEQHRGHGDLGNDARLEDRVR